MHEGKRKLQYLIGNMQKEEEDSSINDRVFVCLGKLKENGQPHAWVMTLNQTYDEITFWEANSSQKYTLNGRITSGQDAKLQAYLSPNITE